MDRTDEIQEVVDGLREKVEAAIAPPMALVHAYKVCEGLAEDLEVQMQLLKEDMERARR